MAAGANKSLHSAWRRHSLVVNWIDILRYLLPQFRSLGQTPAQGCDESLIAFGRLGASCLSRRFRQGGRGREPEAHKHRQGFDRDADIALLPGEAAINLIEAFGESSLATFVASGDKNDAIAASAIMDWGWSRRAA
ncbi:hypothetical protein AU467_24260 [Mesorhizobium loti]|uniref:Uncharacterized protein n=1 Tax=Rhizobium loti TaxID=381 RepID=A0A101KS23_RHILI|nr:hypothetical protein AU467_24260 [Mesorhizobium loti]